MSKHAGGRPLLFKTPEDLQKAIDGYFKECKEHKKTVINREGDKLIVEDPLIPTIAGLAYHLGVDRQTIYNYQEREKFFDSIKKARDFIMAQMETKLMNLNERMTGVIFLAKNYGYTDKQEFEHSGNIKIIEVPPRKDE